MPHQTNKPMFNLKERRAEKALQAKKTAKLGHISKQLIALNAVLAEKNATIRSLKNDISTIKSATAEIKTNLITMQGDLVKTKNKLAESDAATDAKAIELAATAGHQPKHINQ
jgi:predicted  nucleic acid-binding Zn-ribbon protein